MSTIRAVIADDEAPLRFHLRSQLTKTWPQLEICAEAENGLQALEAIEGSQPDIAFLDIKMPGLSGLEVAQKISVPCRVVFVTAFDSFAVEAFENAAMDYLLKPVSEARLKITVERLQKHLSQAAQSPETFQRMVGQLMSAIQTRNAADHLEWISARKGEEVQLIPVADIYYFKAEDKYTMVKTRKEEHLIRVSIGRLETSLDPGMFWRVHRGTLVNVRRIAKVYRSFSGRMDITLDGLPDKLRVSRTYAHLFKQM